MRDHLKLFGKQKRSVAYFGHASFLLKAIFVNSHKQNNIKEEKDYDNDKNGLCYKAINRNR